MSVDGLPSKRLGLFAAAGGALIVRSDSNGEDLEAFAGAGGLMFLSTTHNLQFVSPLWCPFWFGSSPRSMTPGWCEGFEMGVACCWACATERTDDVSAAMCPFQRQMQQSTGPSPQLPAAPPPAIFLIPRPVRQHPAAGPGGGARGLRLRAPAVGCALPAGAFDKGSMMMFLAQKWCNSCMRH